MAQDKIFVGRDAELDQFRKVLDDPRGQAVLIVGNRGMGKTWLVNKMAELAENHLSLKCGCVRYEVTPTDSVDSVMALMMDNAFEAANTDPGSFDKVPQRRKQWMALLKTLVPKGGEIAELISALRRDSAKNTREQFLERLRLISKRMSEEGRAIFFIDPEKYMQEKSASAWRIVVKDLPHKIKLVFAQRTEDELAKSRTFRALDNVMRIPARRLGVLKQSEVEELVKSRAKGIQKSQSVLYDSVEQYKGHPYAIQAALDMIKKTRNVKNLPNDPTPEAVAETQWEEVCKVGTDAISLFEAYAILEVGVPDETVQKVSGLETTARKRLQKLSYLKGLLREEASGKRIYHSILSDYVLEQIGDAETKKYHNRAVEVYHHNLAQAKKHQTKPDALAAIRLAEHVLAAEGEMAFVQTFVKYGNELQDLGLFDAFVSLSERALIYVEEDSVWQAAVLGNLGLIYRKRGDLNKAEQMHKKSLEIAKKLGQLDGMALQYGNLGLIYMNKGDLKKAEEMFRNGVKIEEKLGRPEGMANAYSNLGLIYFSRDDLQMAEKMHRKALEIDERIGRSKGIALDYGNLAGIYAAQSDWERAEQTLLDSLKINDKLGQLEGMANDYGNIGTVYKNRGDIKKAREYWKKALGLYKKVGMKPETEKVQRWIDELDSKSQKLE